MRDFALNVMPVESFGAARGYNFVYVTEIALLMATFVAMAPLFRRRQGTRAEGGGAVRGFNWSYQSWHKQ